MSERFPGIDWYCDRCNVYLNDQPGFDDHHYVWKCTECGHKNSISADDIYESEEDFRNYNKRLKFNHLLRGMCGMENSMVAWLRSCRSIA